MCIACVQSFGDEAGVEGTSGPIQRTSSTANSSRPGGGTSATASGSTAGSSRSGGGTSATASSSWSGGGTSGFDPIVIDPPVEEPKSLELLLHTHAEAVIDDSKYYKLSVDRSSNNYLWDTSMTFYKNALAKPKKVKRELIVEFIGTGEVGVDAGALKKEFFQATLNEVNERLFEGEPSRRVVKKDWGLEMLYEVAGPSPSMYDYLVKHEADQCYPMKQDIPLNLSTNDLISFIQEVCCGPCVCVFAVAKQPKVLEANCQLTDGCMLSWVSQCLHEQTKQLPYP